MENNVQEKLMRQLHQNFHLMMEVHEKMRAKGGKQSGEQRIQPGVPHILRSLAKNGSMTKADFKKQTWHKPEELEEAYKKLQEKGLISKSGEGDSAKIELTDAGRQKVEEIKQHKKEMGDKVFGALSADDQQKLSDIMEKLNASMRKLAGDNGKNEHEMDDCPNCGCDQKR